MKSNKIPGPDNHFRCLQQGMQGMRGGANCNKARTRDVLMREERDLHINILERKAANFAFRSFCKKETKRTCSSVNRQQDHIALPDKLLTQKLAMLLDVTSTGRSSDIDCFDIRFMYMTDERVVFHQARLTKRAVPL